MTAYDLQAWSGLANTVASGLYWVTAAVTTGLASATVNA
jgi:hypothetical protein